MVCVILPEMSLLVYMYMTTGGQERGSEGGKEGGGKEGGGREEEGRRKGGGREEEGRRKGGGREGGSEGVGETGEKKGRRRDG